MIKVSLENVKIIASHGIYEAEHILGGIFEVSLNVSFIESDPLIKLEETINYVTLYQIIKKRMEISTPLLETLCLVILDDVKNQFPKIVESDIKICKIAPPVENFTGKLCVSAHKTY
jgi:dihydroneopterin aldolase